MSSVHSAKACGKSCDCVLQLPPVCDDVTWHTTSFHATLCSLQSLGCVIRVSSECAPPRAMQPATQVLPTSAFGCMHWPDPIPRQDRPRMAEQERHEAPCMYIHASTAFVKQGAVAGWTQV